MEKQKFRKISSNLFVVKVQMQLHEDFVTIMRHNYPGPYFIHIINRLHFVFFRCDRGWILFSASWQSVGGVSSRKQKV